MFGRKQNHSSDFNVINLLVGMARELKLHPVKLVKNAIDFEANTKFIDKMNTQIDKELAPKPAKKK